MVQTGRMPNLAPPARYDLPWKAVRGQAVFGPVTFKHRWKPRRIIVLFNAINWMMTLPEPLEQRFQRAILRLEKEHEMRLLNPLEQLVATTT